MNRSTEDMLVFMLWGLTTVGIYVVIVVPILYIWGRLTRIPIPKPIGFKHDFRRSNNG